MGNYQVRTKINFFKLKEMGTPFGYMLGTFWVRTRGQINKYIFVCYYKKL